MGVQINGDTGNVIATKGTFSGDVGIGGTLTYEDVTNIDAVGLITARSGIEIGARPGVAASISVDGNMIISGISTFTQVGATAVFNSGAANDGRLEFHYNNSRIGLLAYHSDRLEIQSDSSKDFTIRTNGANERLRVDSEGKLLVGTSSELLSQNDKLQIADTSANAGIIVHRASNNNSPPYFHFHKSRGTSVGDATIVQSGDELGRIRWNGTNGSGLSFAAEIRATVDGSPGASNDMPGRLQFYTTPDGSGTPTERLRITKDGNVLIQEGTYADRTLGVSSKLQIEGTGAPSSTLSIVRNSNDTNPAYLMFGKSRGTAVGANTILQTGDYVGGLFFYGGDGNDLYSEAAFIRAGIATGRYGAGPTVGSNSMPGVLEFATTLDGDAGARKHVEIDGDGIFKLMSGNTENDNNSGFDKNQNPIGFYKITIADETNSSDILMPKPGCLVFIQTYSTYPTYPQPQGSICYIDSGNSKNGAIFLDPYSVLAVKTTLETTVSNCDNNKYTVMPGSAFQTLRITNRLDTEPYTFCITMI